MLTDHRFRLALLAAALGVVLARPASADDAPTLQELADRVEALEKQNKELREKTETKDEQPGNNPSLAATWDNGLVFLSPHKDWRIHVGGRIMFQSDWWAQPASLQGPPPGNGGVPAQGPGGGVGVLEDGTFFRRVRFRADGTGYEFVEFALEVNFEQLNQITFDHVWMGIKEVPVFGTVRVGNHKVPQGIEMMGSDYHLSLLERSSLSDAFWTLFAPGVFISNTYFDQHMTSQLMLHKLQPLGVYNAAAFGDGDGAFTGRLTGTPLYECEGRYVVHVGGSYQWRTGNRGETIGGTGNAYADTQDVVRFRARPEQRDAVGVGQVSLIGGNAARFVDTGFLLADFVHTTSPELLLILGPFSVQAEAAWVAATDTRTIYPTDRFNQPLGTVNFWGGYVQCSYFLTGEHRGYDRRFGTYDRPRVRQNARFARDEDGCCQWGGGAWELAYRYSHVDVNDAGIGGGRMQQHTAGVNWYLNDNTKMQFQYLNAHRDVPAPAASGTVHALGVLFQWYF